MKDVTPLPKKAAGESAELLLMRSFSALRHKVTRKAALAAAHWMVRYASDYSIKFVDNRQTPRDAAPQGSAKENK